jgi:phosphate transport system permease protein
VLLGVASLIAVPAGLLVGMFLWHNRDSKLSSISRLLLDVMTGIPAVVIGVFMYTICFGKQSVLAGGASLAMIMLPIFARTTEQALASIPATVHEAGLALGIARRKVVLRIILRSSMPAVLTGLFLAVARVGGEAAPLLFTSYGDNNWPSHSVSDLARLQPIVNESIKSLPIALYEYSDSAFPEQRNLAWAAALVLVCMILAVRLKTRVYTRIRYGSGGALTV